MLLPTPSELRSRAAGSLAQAPDHRRLVLISAGVSALIALAVSGVNFLLQQGIGNTGGLSGLGTRSVLSTVQSLLTLAMTVLLPFWSLGYTAVTLKLAKHEPAQPKDLLAGFRAFLPVLRLFLLLEILYLVLAMTCLYLGSMLLSFTPLATGLHQTLMPILLEGGDPAAIDPELLLTAMLPIFIGCLVLFALVAIPLSYRLRMAQLCLLEDPKAGARRAMVASFRMTRKNALALFRLDLQFWWFYLLEAVLAVIAYGDVLLPLLGLEMNATAAYFLFYAVSLGLQLVLYRQAKNPVYVTYAHAYLSLRTHAGESGDWRVESKDT